MDKKTFSTLRKEGIDIEKSSMKDVIKDFQTSDAPQFKGKSDKKKKEMAIAAKLSKEEVEVDEAKSKLPPHLAKFFDKDGNLKKDAAARVAKGREKINWIDVTPKGYGPKEEVEIDEDFITEEEWKLFNEYMDMSDEEFDLFFEKQTSMMGHNSRHR